MIYRYSFRIDGRPQGKGRPRHNSRGATYTDKKTRQYEEHVRQSFRKGNGVIVPKGKGFHVTVKIVASFKVPVSDSRAVAEDKKDGIIPIEIKPDADNITKIILDALNGEAWEDDSQVSFLSIAKEYSDENYVEVEITAYRPEQGGERR